MIIRRSPIVIIKDFIAVEVLAGFLYLLFGFLAHYAAIYRTLPFSQFVSYQIAQAIFLFFGQTFIIVIIFFRWHREYFKIEPGKLVHSHGLVWLSETSIPLTSIQTISFIQGPLGRYARYGTIILNDFSGKLIQFRHIPDVQDAVRSLQEAKEGRNPSSGKESSVPAKLEPSAILSAQESENLEFKSTLRWDARAGKVNKDLEKSAIKTVAAFLNSRGGHLVIGMDDDKNILGLEHDYKTLNKKNADGFENHFSNIFNQMLGSEVRHLVSMARHDFDGKECAVVSVAPSRHPIYLKDDEKEEFYIRTGNGTTALKISQAAAYIESRFK